MIIRIEDLKLRTIVGIYEWEKENKQDIVINVEIEFDGTKAIETDDIADTIDYKSITKKIITMVEESEFNLIERIAGEAIKIIMENEKVEKASVRVDKPGALRFTDSVSVTQTETR
ncbi:MAG: dihydroneopterin aldolase [Thermodesulfobacteriales bacterium]|jgi:D-erythro-7,8-dihydroneopterin triphosphate epimerase|nr:MAG: dihydroneopterin aldolase [Thermodesulfobacteriales bacterium]